VTLLLEDEIDISRGDMIVRTADAKESALVTRRIEAMLCWLGDPARPQRKYVIRQTTRDSSALLDGIEYRLDINSLQQVAAEGWHERHRPRRLQAGAAAGRRSLCREPRHRRLHRDR
jgi:sulfate adenylyltransferase subunit 1